jgi:hypothetical protein
MTDQKPPSGNDREAPEPPAQARRPSKAPSHERWPGRKPEEADASFEDLQIRESGNRREPG